MDSRPGVVELFAGGGGAALGLRRAGFSHIVAVERDRHAAATLRAAGFQVEEKLVEQFRYKGPRPALLWASPPCVPWSSAGKRAGLCDPRALWPVTFLQIRQFKPVWVVVENVVGAPMDDWAKDLEEFGYKTVWTLNAKDFRVPQDRARKFLVAGPALAKAPKPTGSVTASDAVPEFRGKWLRTEMITARARSADAGPAPTVVTRSILYVYPTDVGVRATQKLGPGGRIGTVREVALLHGFPEDWPFQGNKSEQWKQVGNAVPPALAEAIGLSILQTGTLSKATTQAAPARVIPLRQMAPWEAARMIVGRQR